MKSRGRDTQQKILAGLSPLRNGSWYGAGGKRHQEQRLGHPRKRRKNLELRQQQCLVSKRTRVRHAGRRHAAMHLVHCIMHPFPRRPAQLQGRQAPISLHNMRQLLPPCATSHLGRALWGGH